jgi:tetratricopeptide (TPR) repeat protein
VTTREILDQGRLLLESEYAREPRVAATIALSLAQAYAELGAYDRELELLATAESLAVAGGAPEVVLLAGCERARNLKNRQLVPQALALFDSLRPAIAAAAPVDAAPCLSQQAEVEIRAGLFDSAAATGRRAAALLERSGDTTGMQYISVLNTAANALENVKRRREALQIYGRIAAVMDHTGRDKSVARNIIRNNIGIALSNLGEMTAAEPVLHETMETVLRGDTSGFVHPAILINYCRTVLFLRQLDSAALWYERLYTQSAARNDLTMQQEGARGMADVELARGRLTEAARWIAEEKRLSARLPTPRPTNGVVLDGALAHARGDPAAATRIFRQALRAMGYADGKRTYQMRGVLIHAAEAALDARDPGAALEYARAAHGIAVSDSLSETRSAYVGEARLLEGRALLAAADTAGARRALSRAVTALRAGVGAGHPRAREAETLVAALPR